MNDDLNKRRIHRLVGRTSRLEVRNRVLVVEDDRDILRALTLFLNQIQGIEIVTAMSLAEAEVCLAEGADSFFCTVLDLNLPDAPNGEVVDLVRKQNLPVIVLTSNENEDVRQSMRKKLVLDYVIKRNMDEIEYVAYLVGRILENQQVKVLVVEDTALFRVYLQSLLENYRYQVLLAENGRHGLEVLEEHPDISLVVADNNMPVMDGVTMIKEIRKSHRREDLAIIGISSSAKREVTVQLLKAGANDFITKPFVMEEFYCRVTQNTNMVSYVRKIKDSAIRDFLTKVYNRRHLFELAESLYANAQRELINIAVALIDADHFKRINDTHGHIMGDQALVVIASTLQNSLRCSDVVARFGGEEFVCIVVIRQERDAAPLFEKVRKALEDIDLRTDSGEAVSITASIGVTTNLAESFDGMLSVADEAVYEAKGAGRNCVVCK